MKNNEAPNPQESNAAQISAIHSNEDDFGKDQASSFTQPQAVCETIVSTEVDANMTGEQNSIGKTEEGQTGGQEESSRSRTLKVILLAMTVLLGASSLILGITFYILEADSSLDPLLLSLNLSLFALIVGAVLFAICTFAVWLILKKITLGLHLYWFLCLIATAILILLAFSAIGVSFNSSECTDPTSYFLSQIQLVSSSGQSLFCSTECPCPSGDYSTNTTVYQNIQECPNWQPNYYSQLLQALEEAYQCTGWCSPVGMSIFSQIFFKDDSSVGCFDSLQQYVNNQSWTLKVVGALVSALLLLIIFVVDCYIFSIVQDEDRNQLNQHCKQEQKPQVTTRTDNADAALAIGHSHKGKIDSVTETKRKLMDTTRKPKRIRRRKPEKSADQEEEKKEKLKDREQI